MSFFIRGRSDDKVWNNGRLFMNKGKRKSTDLNKKTKKKRINNNIDKGEEIESDTEDELDISKPADYESEDNADETAQDKKVRLAKLYLAEIEKQELDREESNILAKDAVALRLKEDYLEEAGKLRKQVADDYVGYRSEDIKLLRCKAHKLSITCVIISSDNKFIYSASKDCGIVKWSLLDKCKLNCQQRKKKLSSESVSGHTSTVLCLAISTDSKFLASGDENKIIHIWHPDTLEHLHTFKGHNGVITGLVFRKGSHQLYSASADKSVKVWSLDEMAYIETLFGHQTSITSIDALSRERAVTSGGRDHTIRIWKIVEESQLIYNGHTGSIDAVKLINEDHFISCGDDGKLCLWGTMKKRPLHTIELAHGIDILNKEPNWISSIATITNADLFASGSSDGYIKLWKCDNRTLTPVLNIPVVGFINSMSFTSDGNYLIVGVGQEHRLGRWWRIKEAKNGIIIIPLIKKDN